MTILSDGCSVSTSDIHSTATIKNIHKYSTTTAKDAAEIIDSTINNKSVGFG